MTFCLGISVEEGLVGLADTRVVTGYEAIVAKKTSVYHGGNQAMFIMTSGLRSLRDKSLVFFDEVFAEQGPSFDRLFKAVNSFANQVRRVAQEDRKPLQDADLKFNIHALIGGQMGSDKEQKLYLVYPEGNWVEVGEGTPFHIIGATGYGKPILERSLTRKDSMLYAFKVGYLAFDSSRICAADVGFPIDVLLYKKDSFRIIEHRYYQQDLAKISDWWQERMRESVKALPSEWVESAFSQIAADAPGDREVLA